MPISKITECVKFAEEKAKEFGVRAPMVGHMGDGNFHVVLPYEHGVGLHKKEYLLEQHPDSIPVMKSIKKTLDPNNIMNPGKIFDLN